MKKIKLVHFNYFLPFFILIAVVAVAFLLRARVILAGDFYFLVDQARDMLLTKSIVVDHKFTLIGARTGFGGLFHGPLWLYMLVPTFLASRGDPFFTLTPVFLLVSIAIVVSGFFVGKALYNWKLGIILAALLALCEPLVSTVPFSTNAQVLPLVVLWYIYTTILYIRRTKYALVAALFLVGLSFQFESAFAFLLLPLLLIATVLRGKLPHIKEIGFGVVCFLIPLSTFILFDLRHHFLMTNSFLRLFGGHIKPLPGYEQYARISFRVTDRLTALVQSIFTPAFEKNMWSQGSILVLLFGGIFLMTRKTVTEKTLSLQAREYLFLLLSPVIIFSIYILYPLPLWPHYVLPICVFAVVILTVSSQYFMESALLRYIPFLAVFILSLPGVQWIQASYLHPFVYDTTSDGSFRNQVAVADWVIKDAKGEPFGYFEYTPGILTYNMDYLLWWDSNKRHVPIPVDQKQNTTYFILYPRLKEDVHAYDFWKAQVVRTQGIVLQKTLFPSGISVEKLHIDPKEQPADPNYYQNLIFR